MPHKGDSVDIEAESRCGALVRSPTKLFALDNRDVAVPLNHGCDKV
jgi:hypothetical protein